MAQKYCQTFGSTFYSKKLPRNSANQEYWPLPFLTMTVPPKIIYPDYTIKG